MDFAKELDRLKQHVFYEIMSMTGRVYVIVRYSQRVYLGNRGFTKEEQEKGIVLAFNPKMNFQWVDGAIDAKLVFGTTVERCYIPSEDIVVVFSPDVNIRFIADVPTESLSASGSDVKEDIKRPQPSKPDKSAKVSQKEVEKGKVIEVDFSKKKK